MSSPKPIAASLDPKLRGPNAPKEDLWEQALTTLSAEDRKQYVDSSSSPGEVLQKVRYDRDKFPTLEILSSAPCMLRITARTHLIVYPMALRGSK